MTEQERSLPSKPEYPFLPEGFKIPEDSVLIANVIRDYYEATLIHKIIRTSDLPEEMYTPAEKDVLIKFRFANIKYILTSLEHDPQTVLDSVDFEALAKDKDKIRDSKTGEPQAKAYQLENGLRSSINLVSEVYKPKIDKSRKIFIKRYMESKKIAEENNIPEEDVFIDQQLYFQLTRRSSSPEDIVSQTKDLMELVKLSLHTLFKNDARMEMLIANAENQQVTIDQIDKRISHTMDTPSAKADTQETILDFEDYMQRYTHKVIERYWGEKIAQVYK